MKLNDSVFIVAGGASGLGAATVRMLVGEGAKVVIADLDAANGAKLAADLGNAVKFVEADVADEPGVKALFEITVRHHGGLHGMVNCAGILPGEKVLGSKGPHRLETFSRAVNINLVGAFNLIRLAAESMSKSLPNEDGERGILITTASIAAFDGQIGQAAYAASKGGIVAMTLPIARELAELGIRVMTIAPGTFETPMLAALPQEKRDALGRLTPFPPRLGRPPEFARLVRDIIENPMLNGETIRLDGAQRMAAK